MTRIGAHQLPAAFAFLADEPNAAVDAMLAETLGDLPALVQVASLELIGQRGHASAMAAVVGGFQGYAEPLRDLVAGHIHALFGGVRRTMSDAPYRQASAIRLIAASGCTKLAYLLADALKSSHVRTREEAALALHELAARWCERRTVRGARAVEANDAKRDYAGHRAAEPKDAEPSGPASPEQPDFDTETDTVDLAGALKTAVKSWETHHQPLILEAASWMSELLIDTIQEKLAERRTRIASAINDLIAGHNDPRATAFVLRALTIPALREGAARTIAEAKEPVFILALLDQTVLLEDREIRRGCRWIRRLRWLSEQAIELTTLSEHQASSLVTLIESIGGSTDARIELYRKVLTDADPFAVQLVVRRLAAEESDAAAALLSLVAGRGDQDIAKLAAEALAEWEPGHALAHDGALPALDDRHAHARAAWSACWRGFDGADDDARTRLIGALRENNVDIGLQLRRTLASGRTSDRIRAMRIVQAAGFIETLAERVYALVHDPDAIVRSMAVAALMKLPGPTTQRLLRAAANDTDPRVQANAIEVFDGLDLADREAFTADKLTSRHCRVRANAVKSLLRTELHDAAEALLDMLADASQAHRLSALWVVERLHMRSLVQRLIEMSRQDPDRKVQSRARRVLSTLISETDPTAVAAPSAGSANPTDSPVRMEQPS